MLFIVVNISLPGGFIIAKLVVSYEFRAHFRAENPEVFLPEHSIFDANRRDIKQTRPERRGVVSADGERHGTEIVELLR